MACRSWDIFWSPEIIHICILSRRINFSQLGLLGFSRSEKCKQLSLKQSPFLNLFISTIILTGNGSDQLLLSVLIIIKAPSLSKVFLRFIIFFQFFFSFALFLLFYIYVFSLEYRRTFIPLWEEDTIWLMGTTWIATLTWAESK